MALHRQREDAVLQFEYANEFLILQMCNHMLESKKTACIPEVKHWQD